jgi:hypothetical protein
MDSIREFLDTPSQGRITNPFFYGVSNQLLDWPQSDSTTMRKKLLAIWWYNKTCLKRNAMVPVFFFCFHRFPFYKGLCFKVQKIWSLRITMKE